MEIKKSKKAEIERHRSTWFLVGFISVLAFMFVAFEWGERDKVIDTSMLIKGAVFELDVTPVTFPENTLPPPPPPAAIAPEVINIVDNNTNAPETSIAGSENVGDAVIPVYIPPVVIEVVPVEPEILDFAEVMPSYPGGVGALNAFLAKSIKYPTISIENGTQGKVIVQFVVDKDGSIVNPTVVRGVDPYLDKEALRVIKMMPKWSPGMQQHKPVRVKFTVPVVFKLQ